MYFRILIPIDGTSRGEVATTHGLQLARQLGSRVVFLFVVDALVLQRKGVVDMSLGLAALHTRGREILQHALETAREVGVPAEATLAEAMVAEAIVEQSSTCDLVVLGTRGRSLLQSILRGSITEHIVHHVRSSLLIVRCEPGA